MVYEIIINNNTYYFFLPAPSPYFFDSDSYSQIIGYSKLVLHQSCTNSSSSNKKKTHHKNQLEAS